MRQGGGRSGEAEGKPGRLEQEQGKLRTNTEALAATPGTEPPSFMAPGADTGSGSKPSSLPSSKPTAAPPEEDRSFQSQQEGQGKAAWAGRAPGTFPCSRLFRPQLQGLPWLPVALRDRPQVLIRQQRLEAQTPSLSLPACVAVASDPTTTCPSASPRQRQRRRLPAPRTRRCSPHTRSQGALSLPSVCTRPPTTLLQPSENSSSHVGASVAPQTRCVPTTALPPAATFLSPHLTLQVTFLHPVLSLRRRLQEALPDSSRETRGFPAVRGCPFQL